MGRINTATVKSAGSFDIWNRAFRGAFVGAIAGMTFATLIGGITGIANATFDASRAAVQAAADFQVTRNAFVVFTGSASAARAELKEIAALVRTVPGLRLQDAEDGAKNLRALGFEAKLTQDLVVGLAKQKILAGADEGAINRVIVNLTQLASGSPRASQDIREMIQSIRTLRPEIIEAFGSINKFREQIARDPERALETFANQLKTTQVPAAGLNDAIGKLLDSFTIAGRAFGEPILDPLTDDVKALTEVISANDLTWRSWGQSVADAILTAGDAWETLQQLDRELAPPPRSFVSRSSATLWDVGTAGWQIIGAGLTAPGRAERFKREAEQRARELRGEPELRRQLGVPYGPVSEGMIGERNVERDRQERRALNAAETARKIEIANLKRNKDEVLDIARDRYRVEQAMLNSHLRLTSQQELQYLKQSGASRLREARNILNITANFYDQTLQRVERGSQEELEIQSDKSRAISKLSAELRIAEFENARAIAEQEHQIREERRRAEIDFKQLQIRGAQDRLDNALFYIEREIQMNESGYDRLVDSTRQSYEEISRITREAYDLQLRDATLTAEQRINIEKERDLALQQQADRHGQQMQQIRDRMWQQTMRDIQRRSQISLDALGGRGAINQAAFDLFTPEFLQGGRSKEAITSVFGDYLRAVDTFIAKSNRLRDDLLQNRIDTIAFAQSMNTLNAEFAKVESRIPGIQTKILGFLEDIQAGRADFTIFDQITQQTLEASQMLERSKIEVQINRVTAELEAMIAMGVKSGGEIEAKRGERGALEKQLQAFDLISAKAKLTVETIKNLRAEIEALRTGDPITNAAIQYQNFQSVLIDQRNTMLEARAQELRLGDENLVRIEREIALTKELTAVKEEEFQAVLRMDASRLRIDQQMIYSKNRADAAVLEFIASQKGITEIVSDTKINLLSTAYSGLESVADRLTQKFGAFRDVIKDLVANLLKLAFNKLFGNFFAPGGATGGAGGGFSLGGISLGGGGGLFGGGRGYTTPPFNPAAAGAGIFGGDFASVGDYGAAIGAGQGLLGQGTQLGGSAISGLAGAGVGGLGAGIAAMLPLLGLGLGTQLGAPSVGGQILGGLGGLAAGVAGFGLLAPGAMASMFGLVGGFLATGIGAIAAPLLLLGAFFLGRNAQRRKDERTRNGAMINALDGLTKLIDGVRSDKIDGASALEQADQIRAQYVESMSQLKDKKTRNIALKDVSRLDAKITELKGAVDDQVSRRERLELMVPTFAYGGSMGYQMGPGHGRSDNLLGYFPSSGVHARTSPGEYVLDAETTGTVGVANLDLMRATKGASYSQLRKQMVIPRMQAGGQPVALGNGLFGMVGAPANNQPIVLEVSLNIGLSAETFAKVVSAAVKRNDGSKEQIEALVTNLKNQGSTELIGYIFQELKKF